MSFLPTFISLLVWAKPYWRTKSETWRFLVPSFSILYFTKSILSQSKALAFGELYFDSAPIAWSSLWELSPFPIKIKSPITRVNTATAINFEEKREVGFSLCVLASLAFDWWTDLLEPKFCFSLGFFTSLEFNSDIGVAGFSEMASFVGLASSLRFDGGTEPDISLEFLLEDSFVLPNRSLCSFRSLSKSLFSIPLSFFSLKRNQYPSI